MNYSVNPDLLCATSDWLYMTYRRLGEDEKAAQLLEAITPDMNIIENDAYHQRLLMYKGLVKPGELLDFDNADMESRISTVTQGYGVGNYWLQQGEKEKAFNIFRKVLETGYWSAFGYIAAEADLFHASAKQVKKFTLLWNSSDFCVLVGRSGKCGRCERRD